MSEADSWHGSKFSQYFHGLDRQRVYGSSARTIQLAVNSIYCTYPTIGTDINCLLCVATLREGMQKSRNMWPKDTELAQSIKYIYTQVDQEKLMRFTNRAMEDPSPEYCRSTYPFPPIR